MSSSRIYTVTGAVADGDFLLSDALGEKMSDSFTTGVVSVTMYTDDTFSTAVAATAGTLTVTATEDGFNFGTVDNNVVDLTVATYSRPSWYSRVNDLNFAWAGVTGATHFQIQVWRVSN